MAKNLDVDVFRNGDPIKKVENGADWDSAVANKQSAWCYPDFDPTIGAKYGKIYNYYAVSKTDNFGIHLLAPNGYHIPSEVEFNALIGYLGGGQLAPIKMASPPPSWPSQDSSIAYNQSGFSALPGGRLPSTISGFQNIDTRAYWWTSDMTVMRMDLSLIKTEGSVDDRGGYYVRCKRDN